MKNLVLISMVMSAIMFSACAKKDNSYYDRANKASEKSLIGLEKDTQ